MLFVTLKILLFHSQISHGVVQALDQDEDEFTNLVKKLAGGIDPDDFCGF